MLYLIGIGLFDEKDITLRGLEAVKKSDYVYLESYTSKLSCSVDDLSRFYGKKVILADRSLVEQADEILRRAETSNVSLLIIGDVFMATTHTDIRLRAKEKNIPINIIHNASVFNAIGITGLELYKFGKICSIPFDNKNVVAPYDVIKDNLSLGLHTLVLLDLNHPNYMSVSEALDFLLSVEKKRKENIISESTFVVACSRLGSPDQKIVYTMIKDVPNLGDPLHCLVIPGKLHFMESDSLSSFQKL